jgi:hypothetical protein
LLLPTNQPSFQPTSKPSFHPSINRLCDLQ